MQRLALRLRAASAAANAGDTGVAYGELTQIRWVPTTGDTGADLLLSLCPLNNDTGAGWLFANYNDALGVQFTRSPRQPVHDLDGTVAQFGGAATDTGAALMDRIFACNERIRAKSIAAGNAAVDGTLYLWFKA